MSDNTELLEELKEMLKKSLDEMRDKNQQTLDQALNEVKTLGTIVGKTNDELKAFGAEALKTQAQLREVEQRLDGIKAAVTAPEGSKSLGHIVTDSEEFKAALAHGNAREMKAVSVGSFRKAIINATGQNQPLVDEDRVAGIITPAERLLTIRNLIPTAVTGSNMIEFALENVYTNAAAPQYSSPAYENVAKAESNIIFTLSNTPVVTLAHWIPASRQVLSDAGMLRGYIDSRLMYGLKLEEEDQILNGDGTGGALNGLLHQATAYNRHITGDQGLDTLLKAMLQVTLSEYVADGVVLNHIDWTDIMLLKDTTGRYLFSNPESVSAPRVWGRPVIPTNSIANNQFLVGAFGMAAQLFDREQATIRVAEQHSDFFVKNMVAILAEERLALAVYRPAALVKGAI